MFFCTAIAACLLLLLLSLTIVPQSDSNLKSAAHFLEGMVAQMSNGEIYRSKPVAGSKKLGQLPEELAGFSESFSLLARLLQGHCQVAATVLDFLSPGVTILSGKFRILTANRSFCSLVGGTPGSVQGKLLGEVFPEAIAGLHLQDSSLDVLPGQDFVTLIKGADGTQVYRARLTEILHGEGDEGVFVLMLADVADSDQPHSDRREFRKLYESILESVSEAILVVERDGSVIEANPLAAKLLGLSREDLAGTKLQSFEETTSEVAGPTLNSYFSSSNWQLDGRVLKTRAVRKGGAVFSAEFVFRELEAGGQAGYFVKLRDVTQDELADTLAREQLRVVEMIARNQPLEIVLETVGELVEHQIPGSYCVVMIKRGDRLIPVCAPRMPAAFVEALSGYPLDAVVTACTTAFVEGKTILFEDIASRPVGEPLRDEALRRGVHSSISAPVFSCEGLVIGLITVFRPETEEPSKEHADLLQLATQLVSVCVEQREINDQLAYRAQHDALTGLQNRVSFEERLRHAIVHAARYKRQLALLSVDLDRFKLINDTLGHAAGDDVLKQLAGRLVGSLRETDVVARWGGDEFVIGLMEIGDPHDAVEVAEKLMDALKTPFDIEGRQSIVSASIGVSVFPDDGRDLEALMRHADTAMYRAKKGGRNGCYCCNARLGETDRQRLEMERQLRGALDRGELDLHYQPQIDLRTRSLVGVEALLRWRNPHFGVTAPSIFIPIAEETGAIVPIGEWVIREACEGVKKLGLAGFDDLRVAVNVSGLQFARQDFMDLVATTVAEAGIEPHQLELELTESLLMEPGDESAPRMAKLRALGIRMSIDDFGTGYSCLSYLHRLPVDTIKIDQSFVQDLGESSRTPLLVESIVALSSSLGMLSIAEGVELPSQLAAIGGTGCNLVQGFLFCEPLPIEELIARARQHCKDGTWRLNPPVRHRFGPAIQRPVSIHGTAMAKYAASG
jgi:diguanylate cyclase (GGDEF)-like protein/PAS domain S-box-containing protein